LIGLEEFGDSVLVATTTSGVFKRKGDTWEKIDIPTNEEGDDDIFWNMGKVSDSLLVLLSTADAYFVDKNFDVLFNTPDVGGADNSLIPFHVTQDGTVWMLTVEGIIRVYPQIQAQNINIPMFTYTKTGQPFAWQNSDLVVSDAFGSSKYSVQAYNNQFSLTETNIYKEGDGTIIGVYENEDATLMPHQNELIEYEGDDLISDIELEYSLQSFFRLNNHEDQFLTGIRGGLGFLKREAGIWKQQIIMEDPEFAKLAGVTAVKNATNLYRGATDKGTIFEVEFSQNGPKLHPGHNLRDELNIQQVQDICYLGDDFTVLTNRGMYKRNSDLDEWEPHTQFQNELDGFNMQICTPENGSTYLYGENNRGSGIWQYNDGALRRVPIQSDRIFSRITRSPSGELWIPESSSTKIVDIAKVFKWYDSTKTELFSWAEYDSILISSDVDRLELPHDYSSFTIHGGFNNHFFSSENQFRLAINGSNNSGWQENSTYSLANLPPGEYAIQLQGRNGLGQIHHSSVFDLRILPPWYLSTMALNMYVLGGLLFIGFLVHSYGQYRARKQQALDRIKSEEREKVRKKLAADFHDELGNRITRIGLHIKILQQGKQDKMEGILSKMESNTNSLYAETRDFIWQMDPRKDSLYDTYSWLKSFGEEFFEDSQIDFMVKPIQSETQQVTLDMEVRTNIVRIFKEAMNNTQKYSEANTCTLSIVINESDTTIEFKDNGKGMDVDSALTKGNGLNNMIERSKNMEGELSITANEEEGTSIRYSFILDEEK
jgi:signal transduction histidine kinase